MEDFMKTRFKRRICKFQLRLPPYGGSYYIDRIAKMETALARKPKVLQLDMIGTGEIPADTALLMRAVLLARSPKTKLVTNARSSLQNGSVLVWLLGDRRLIRDDARVFFRRTELADKDEVEVHAGLGDAEAKYKDSYSEIDPEEADHARVLQVINEYLPVEEFVGRIVGVPVLRQFGLIENERVDNFLVTAFSKSRRPLALG
jgi:hypothetical protein